MNLVIFGIGILLCLVLGILLSYFTVLNWLPASLLVFGALHLHAAMLSFVDARSDNSKQSEHASGIGYGNSALWFWLQNLLITLLTAGLGAYLQINH